MQIEKIEIIEAKDYNERRKPSKMFIDIKDESVMKHLENRHFRPYTTYKKEIIPEAIKKLKEEKDVDLLNCKFSWNQYAGCSCGCSPGFIIKNFGLGKRIYITIIE